MTQRATKGQLMFSRKLTKPIAIGAMAIAIAGGAYGIVNATASNGASTATTATSTAGASGRPGFGGRGSNARPAPAEGGAVGTVGSVSKSNLTVSTSAGQKVTVNKTSSTKYRKGAQSVSAAAIKKGQSV